MEKLDNKIKTFGKLFMNRLDNEILQDAINYVDYNERGLAFETICDHISEFNVPITQDEYNEAIAICNLLYMNKDDISIKHMKELIKS